MTTQKEKLIADAIKAGLSTKSVDLLKSIVEDDDLEQCLQDPRISSVTARAYADALCDYDVLKGLEGYYTQEDIDEAYGFLDDYIDCEDEAGKPIKDFDAVVNLMDDDLREGVHAKLAPCTYQAFLVAYAKAHKAKFGEDFAPWVGGEW